MFDSRTFKNAFFFLVIVGGLNAIAIKFHLYWTLHYFDTLVHFIAGVCVGFAGLWFFSGNIKKRNLLHLLAVGCGVTLLIGILWEIFELSFGITLLSDGRPYFTDTGLDLVADVLGGVLASFYQRRRIVNQFLSKYGLDEDTDFATFLNHFFYNGNNESNTNK